MRTTYNNGDDIGLTECGCDGCTPASVNGTMCHEHGCPDAWRDRQVECPWCGQMHYPTLHTDHDLEFCDDDCASAYHS